MQEKKPTKLLHRENIEPHDPWTVHGYDVRLHLDYIIALCYAYCEIVNRVLAYKT